MRKFKNIKLTKRQRKILYILIFIIILIAVFSYLTNPFVRFSLVKDPHPVTQLSNGQIELVESQDLKLRQAAFWHQLARVKASWHIFISKFSGGKKADKATVDEIIKEIHDLRFDPDLPFLISGDHFSILYPRSLGIFYHSLLDSRTALNEQDWQNRQKIYLKTTAYALSVYDQSDRLSTTIVPIAPSSVILVDFHYPPSDTLYSLLYALDVLQNQNINQELYSFENNNYHDLQTQAAAQDLLTKYKPSLKKHFENYYQANYDPDLGLIKKNIYLSSTKDQFKRQSAFYDNVIFYQTCDLAIKFGLTDLDQDFLANLKQNILDNFWLEPEGYFLEDLSEACLEDQCYSSDWLIILITGFLDIQNPDEIKYYQASIDYIRRNALDQPFGLQYHSDLRKRNQVRFLRYFLPSYGSTAIWSNWGQEYIKALVLLYQATGKQEYLDIARDQLETYTFNIRRYRGYPELYDENGDFYKTPIYKAVRRTGWVVSFEQAREMYEAVTTSVDLTPNPSPM